MTDVVGSTALWEVHGGEMAAALEQHDRAVHGAVASVGGRVFKHTGDGMIAVFADADAAASAAFAALEALEAETWGPTGLLRVRVSIHAGAVNERNGDCFGPAVNRVARINGVGHGGQILASDVARQLMSRPVGTDVGEHQLRDLSEPVRLWQLDENDHPPLRTLQAKMHNLPVMATEFIGRDAEVTEVRELVARNRSTTIVGVGGCGKTRLAIEVAAASADRFPGGVWFVDLTSERDGAFIGDAAIGALGLARRAGSEARSAIEVLADATSEIDTLVVLDNCEHLIDDVAEFVGSVLSMAPSVSVLATSRESLAIDGERVWRIPNLGEAAVELFLQRATAAGATGLDTHHDRIAQLCHRLDDIPLAIELAASRTVSMSIDDLAERLDDRFALLGGGRNRRRQRQQTLQTMMDWSYGLLDPGERAVLDQRAVFAGSFPLAGAEAVVDTDVVDADALDSLVQQSMLVAEPSTGRYRLLETVRRYALDRLLADDRLVASRDRHLRWIAQLFGREFTENLPTETHWDVREAQFAEIENASAAMEWAEQTGDHDALIMIFITGRDSWMGAGATGLQWLDRVQLTATASAAVRCAWLVTRGTIRWNTGDLAGGYEEMLAGAATFDDIAGTGTDDARWLAQGPGAVAWLYRGLHHLFAADEHAEALAVSDQLVDLQAATAVRTPTWCAQVLRGFTYGQSGEYPKGWIAATEAMREGLTIVRTSYDTAAMLVAGLANRVGRFEESLAAAHQTWESPVAGQTSKLLCLGNAGKAAARLGRYDEALDIAERSFGPMTGSQRRQLDTSRLVLLATSTNASTKPAASRSPSKRTTRSPKKDEPTSQKSSTTKTPSPRSRRRPPSRSNPNHSRRSSPTSSPTPEPTWPRHPDSTNSGPGPAAATDQGHMKRYLGCVDGVVSHELETGPARDHLPRLG